MKPVISLIARGGATLHPLATLALLVAINVQWVLTLQAFGTLFERSAGVPLLDLANVQGVVTPETAQQLITQYSASDISLYWTFFAMDNVVPVLSFGTYALLWGFLLLRSRLAIGTRLAGSWLMLLPFGVGGFDIVENLFFISAIASDDSASQLTLLTWGLVFVQAKAIALVSTFVVTGLLLVFYTVGRIRLARRSPIADR